MKKILVTGATSGIGKAIAEHYRSKNYEVTTASRTDSTNSINFAHLSEEEAEMLLKDQNVVVLNHGIMRFEECPYSQTYEDIAQTNFSSYCRLLHLIQRERSIECVILNASVAGVTGNHELPYYSAQKAGIINLAKSFAMLLAPRVRVNSFSCGLINDTNLCPEPMPQEMIARLVPLKISGTVQDVVRVVELIEKSPFMTGANIVLDGGESLRS